MRKAAAILLSIIFTISAAFPSYAASTDVDEEIAALKTMVDSLLNQLGRQNDTIDSLSEQISDITSQNPTPRNPILMVTEPLLIEAQADTTSTYEVTVKNLTSETARNIMTTVSSNNPAIIASIDGDSLKYDLGNKASFKLKIKVSVDKSLDSGFYAISFKHTYNNINNEAKTSDSLIQLKVTNEEKSGSAILRDITAYPHVIRPGDDLDITAVLENTGTVRLTDLQLNMTGFSPDGLYLKASSNIISRTALEPKSVENIKISLASSKKIKTGSYPLVFDLTYEDGEKAQEKSYTYYITVSETSVAAGEKAEVIIENITAPLQEMGVGQDFKMSVALKNISDYSAANVKLTASPEGDGFIVPKSAGIAQIYSLSPGEAKTLAFSFAPTSSAKSRNYVIGFTLEYETGALNDDDTKEIFSYTQYQGVNVTNPKADEEEEKEEKTSVPKIIVSKYKSEPLIVQAGREFDLDMSFLNTSSEKAVKNIKVSLSVDGGGVNTEEKGNVFSPVNASNTFYIDRIEPKNETSRQLRFYTIPDALPKTYIIDVLFEYEDDQNNPYTATEKVGISVKQITKLDLSEIVMEKTGFVGQPIYLNFEMYNTGKVKLSNLMIKVEGNFSFSQKSTYYGTFNISSTEYYDNTFFPLEPGVQNGKIIISYEDDTGEKIEEITEFTIDVMEMEPMPEEMMGPEMMFDPETGRPINMDGGEGLTLPVIGRVGIRHYLGAGAVLAGAAGYAVYKKKKKKESLDDDE